MYANNEISSVRAYDEHDLLTEYVEYISRKFRFSSWQLNSETCLVLYLNVNQFTILSRNDHPIESIWCQRKL